LRAEAAAGIEGDQQHAPAPELRERMAMAIQVGERELGRRRAYRQTGRGTRCRAAAALSELVLQRVEVEQDAAVLAEELESEPAAEDQEQPGKGDAEGE